MRTSTPAVYGRPGAHAGQLAFTAAARAAACAVAGAGVVISAFAAGGPAALVGGGARAVLVAALAAVAAAAFVVARRFSERYSKARIGALSEKKVGRVLGRGGFVAVVHGAVVRPGSGDADHVVLGPVFAVVETKTGTGAASVQDGALRVGRRVLPGDALAQVRRQAGYLAAAAAGAQPSAVVCVPGMTNRPFRHGGVTVCSVSDLLAVLSSASPLPGALDPVVFAAWLAGREQASAA